jgi:hypothetical protein
LSLIEQGLWHHPGDDVLTQAIPWFKEPLVFLKEPQHMEWESRSLDVFADHEGYDFFGEVRGSSTDGPVDLPLLDVEQAVLIAVGRIPGAEIALALDYRGEGATGGPRVVGGDFWTEPKRCAWRVVADDFAGFVALLGIGSSPAGQESRSDNLKRSPAPPA